MTGAQSIRITTVCTTSSSGEDSTGIFFFIFMDDLLDHVAIPRKAAWNGVLRAQTKNLDRGMDYGLVKKVLALKI